jgi:hypothetical protein
MSGLPGLRYNFSRTDIAPDTPLFEKQMTQDEYAEYQQLRAMIDGLHQRISKLEKINTDLENRLEEQAKESIAVETELINMDRFWKSKCEKLTQEIGKWKLECENEKLKNTRLRDQHSNIEKELYNILQRKHELTRGPGASSYKGPGPSGQALSGRYTNYSETMLNRKEESRDGDDFYQSQVFYFHCTVY